ncbi:Phosphate transport system permease protein PstA [Planctomycetes bacterium Pan216]|uniref:Phosphate transport system permease protein PstA n=1 Tax=Kolteria novifilia TaxID=2527975 RepID=A0A518AZB9_9BACT|nr:Phosphate transport system permease protein PstA [Planctomycetes bacterium Pan216]
MTSHQETPTSAGDEERACVSRDAARVGILGMPAAEPMHWLTGGALAMVVLSVGGLLGLLLVHGLFAFWPKPIVRLSMTDGRAYLGEVLSWNASPTASARRDLIVASRSASDPETIGDMILRVSNRSPSPSSSDSGIVRLPRRAIASQTIDPWAVAIDLGGNVRLFGTPTAFYEQSTLIADEPARIWPLFETRHREVRQQRRDAQREKDNVLADVDRLLASKRRELAAARARSQASPQAVDDAEEALAYARSESDKELDRLRERLAQVEASTQRYRMIVKGTDGTTWNLALVDIVRGSAPNQAGFLSAVVTSCERWKEFLTTGAGDSVQQSGIYPAIVGTLAVTMIMTVLVVPVGVMAAFFLREYTRNPTLRFCLRITIRNLAGIPSIVFGVFGLLLFCDTIGPALDALWFADSLPWPTFGKGGLLWAGCTLALLTLPVVIVSTEDAVAVVPSSVRQASYACGASQWQTIQRVILPYALPGIATGTLLAIARAAAAVAPLMLVGAVTMTHGSEGNETFSQLQLDQEFMHLGLHVYNLAFETDDHWTTRPLLYATALVLLVIVISLNMVAIALRSRWRQRLAVREL